MAQKGNDLNDFDRVDPSEYSVTETDEARDEELDLRATEDTDRDVDTDDMPAETEHGADRGNSQPDGRDH